MVPHDDVFKSFPGGIDSVDINTTLPVKNKGGIASPAIVMIYKPL